MRKIILLLPLLMCFATTYAQIANGPVQQTINQQIWYPFVQAYNNLDNDAFMKIHTNDIIRVVGDRSEMMLGQEYADAIAMNVKWHKQNNVTRQIEFSFMERIVKKNTAYEQGYYKVTNSRDGKQRTFYGMFTVVLKRTNGIWKILMDTDTSNSGSINEADFRKGIPLSGVK